jgi:hypothetical protein
MPGETSPSLLLEALELGDSSLRATLRVAPPHLRVSGQLAAAVLACRPTLAQHTCKQQGIGRFADKLVGTSLPHLAEHVAIDLLVEESPSCPQAGTTTWLNREQGRMMVRLSCTSATAPSTHAALLRAIALINTLLAQEESINLA